MHYVLGVGEWLNLDKKAWEMVKPSDGSGQVLETLSGAVLTSNWPSFKMGSMIPAIPVYMPI